MLLAQTNAADFWGWLATHKEAFATLESIFKILALILGGVWAVLHFRRKREAFPRASVEHKIQVWDYSKEEWFLRVALVIHNQSDVLVTIFNGYTWIQQMNPPPTEAIEEFKEASREPDKAPTEAKWPLLGEKTHKGEREVEPTESDEIGMDFFVPKWCDRVLVYSFLENSRKPGRHLGWIASTVVDLANVSGEISDQGEGQSLEKARPAAARP